MKIDLAHMKDDLHKLTDDALEGLVKELIGSHLTDEQLYDILNDVLTSTQKQTLSAQWSAKTP